jgi:hypothetical protein
MNRTFRNRTATGLSVLPVLLIVALAVAGFFGYRWWTGQERVVKKRLEELAEVLSPPPNGELAMVARIAQVRGFFAPDVHIRFDSEAIDSRDALVALLGRWQPPKNGFRLEFADVIVHMVDPGTAHVSLTAEVSNLDTNSLEPLLDAREGTLTMRNIDGEWVIATAETMKTLQR